VDVDAGPWPLVLLSAAFAVVFVAALVVAWRSADRVVAENQATTRAWRVFLACLPFPITMGEPPFSLGPVFIRIMFPLGAIYILIKYGRSVLRNGRSRTVAADA